MKQVRLFRALGIVFATLAAGLTLAAQDDIAAILQKLNSQFKLTTITADRSDIVAAGDVVAIHKPGLVMYAVHGDMLTLTYSATGRSSAFKIQNGQLVSNSGAAWVRTGDAPAPAPEPVPVQAAKPAPAPIPQIVPPLPPADAPPPTIALGQTKDQVTVAFGQPLRVAKLGVKEIYYYKDMKVTFTNGKVSNVE